MVTAFNPGAMVAAMRILSLNGGGAVIRFTTPGGVDVWVSYEGFEVIFNRDSEFLALQIAASIAAHDSTQGYALIEDWAKARPERASRK